MRLTTRLMQLASWLLLQRAANSGEMTREQVAAEKSKVRLDTHSPQEQAQGWSDLPEKFQSLVEIVGFLIKGRGCMFCFLVVAAVSIFSLALTCNMYPRKADILAAIAWAPSSSIDWASLHVVCRYVSNGVRALIPFSISNGVVSHRSP